MKIRNNTPVTVESNFDQKEAHAFSIGDQAMAMEILRSRLYSRPKETLTQEYMCNARDAHREAGCADKPIKITLPTNTSGTLCIRDYGPGISPDKMRNIFSKYCNSTKRGDDSQTGGYGIGSKACWSYRDSFIVITHIDGEVWHYLCHLDEQNIGQLQLLSHEETDQPNGTEIQISIERGDYEDFHKAVYRASFFWKVKPTIFGIPHESIPEWYRSPHPVISSGDLEIYRVHSIPGIGVPYGAAQVVLAVDGIPYEVSGQNAASVGVKSLNELVRDGFKAVIRVETGVVGVAGQRENLFDNAANSDAINALCMRAINLFSEYAQNALSGASSLRECMSVIRKIDTVSRLRKSHEFTSDRGNQYELAGASSLIHPAITELGSMKLLEYCHLKGRSWSNRPSVLNKRQSDTLNFFSNPEIVYIDRPSSKATVDRRVKHLLESRPKGAQVIVIKCETISPELQSVIKDIEAAPISSLHDPYVRTAAKKVALNELACRYQERKKGTNFGEAVLRPIRINLNDLRHLHYYYTTEESAVEGKLELSRYLCDASSALLIIVAKSGLQKIEGNPKFTPLSEFLADPGRHFITNHAPVIMKQISNQLKRSWILHLDSGEVKDPQMRSDLRLVSGCDDQGELVSSYHRTSLPAELLATCISANKELRSLSDAVSRLNERCETTYPLLLKITCHRADPEFAEGRKSELSNELLEYINFKFLSRTKKAA